MPEKISFADLVDIRHVTVNPSLTKEARIEEYKRQIKDPYHFKCGNLIITARYNEDGRTIEECLHGLLA